MAYFEVLARFDEAVDRMDEPARDELEHRRRAHKPLRELRVARDALRMLAASDARMQRAQHR